MSPTADFHFWRQIHLSYIHTQPFAVVRILCRKIPAFMQGGAAGCTGGYCNSVTALNVQVKKYVDILRMVCYFIFTNAMSRLDMSERNMSTDNMSPYDREG